MTHVLQVIVLGLLSGFAGTAVMTMSQISEIRMTKRKPSLTPAIIISKMFGINLERYDEDKQWRLNNLVHWSYGTIWGIPLAIVYFVFVPSVLSAIVMYFLIFWIQGLIVLPAYKVAPPVWRWELRWIGIDALHHFSYAVAAALAYMWLNALHETW